MFRSTSGLTGTGSLHQPISVGGVVADHSGAVYISDKTSQCIQKWVLDGSESGGANIFSISTAITSPGTLGLVYASASLASSPGAADLFVLDSSNVLYLVRGVSNPTVESLLPATLVLLPGATMLDRSTVLYYHAPTNVLYATNYSPSQLIKLQMSSSDLTVCTAQTSVFSGIFGE